MVKERYAQYGVDTDIAIERATSFPISLHCWQGDDVGLYLTGLRLFCTIGPHHGSLPFVIRRLGL